MADNVYGFDDSKSKVQVVDKATQDATDASQDGRLTAIEAKDTEQDGRLTALEEGAIELVAGTGIAIGDDGQTINHKNSVSAQTSYIGSATSVPRLKFDAQGHITGVSTATIYPPTTPGEAGQVWVSDGSGAGSWQTPAGDGEWVYASSFSELISSTGSSLIVSKDFQVMYSYNTSKSGWIEVSAGTYKGTNATHAQIACCVLENASVMITESANVVAAVAGTTRNSSLTNLSTLCSKSSSIYACIRYKA